MPPPSHIGLEQARIELSRLVSQAEAGSSTVITRHGRPCAALVSIEVLNEARTRRGGLLRLQGTGAGLWGPEPARAVAE